MYNTLYFYYIPDVIKFFTISFVTRSIAEKGPTTEEKVLAIEASLATYEAKISGLGRTSS
jgi:hypothetical protein